MDTMFALPNLSLLPHDPLRLDELDFHLPAELEAGQPPEARGLQRDQVRLMVSSISEDQITMTDFRSLPQFLQSGDLLVVNTSGTMNAAVKAFRKDGSQLELHISTHLPADLWSVELRRFEGNSTKPFYDAHAGEVLRLEGGGQVTLLAAYRPDQRNTFDKNAKVRLWIAHLELPLSILEYLQLNGYPIRYKYVQDSWPLEYYQTIFANEPGSAEMPSAGRAFTAELIIRLLSNGIQIAPLLLHTGVASLEDHEPPYEEYFRVPDNTAEVINLARASGQRIIAVGTTVVRALETVSDRKGKVHPGEGWTSLVITPQRGIYSIDGMLTGLHEPRSTHLAMLSTLADKRHLELCYQRALREGMLWHEFGDLHLLLP